MPIINLASHDIKNRDNFNSDLEANRLIYNAKKQIFRSAEKTTNRQQRSFSPQKKKSDEKVLVESKN
jgi:hypothetical protein